MAVEGSLLFNKAMNENTLKFQVGALVIFAAFILGLLIFINSDGWKPKYDVFVKPYSAPGVTKNTPVRKNGILIGRVSDVKSQDDHVILTLAINDDENIYSNETVSIGSDSFLGDAVIEVLPLPVEERGDRLGSQGMISRVSVKRNPMEIVDVALNLESEITKTLEAVRQAGTAVQDAGNGIDKVAGQITSAFDNEQSDFKLLLSDLRNMSVKAQGALDNFNRIFENVNNVVGDPEIKGRVRNAIGSLPELFKEIQLTVADTRETINSFRDVSGKATDNLDNLEVFTESLKEQGPEILTQVNSSMTNVQELIAQVNEFAQVLKNVSESEGTVGKLLNDSQLYDEALATMSNVRELSVKLEPLVNDLRMFADSLARDPRQLGVKGALDKRPLGSGYKGTTTGRRAERGTLLR